MAWTIEDQTRAFLTEISSGRETSARSAFFDLINHFSVEYLRHLTKYCDQISGEVDRLYSAKNTFDDGIRVWADSALKMLSLIKENKCRCEILTTRIPADPLNLENHDHIVNVDGISFRYGDHVTGRYDCSYCGRRFAVTWRPGISDPEWQLVN